MIVTEIGVTQEPIVEIITLTVAGSGLFSGRGRYPAQGIDTALQAVVDDIGNIEDLETSDKTSIVGAINALQLEKVTDPTQSATPYNLLNVYLNAKT